MNFKDTMIKDLSNKQENLVLANNNKQSYRIYKKVSTNLESLEAK